ncbi:unnamed protein product [Closterium sp. NIES-53]
MTVRHIEFLLRWAHRTGKRPDNLAFRSYTALPLGLAVIEAGIYSVWAEEHPARPASPRLVNNKGGVDMGVNAGGDKVSSNAGGTSRISVTPVLVGRPDLLTWKEAIEPTLEMARLVGFARGTVATPEEQYPNLRAEFRADAAMQEAERPMELLAQVNYVAPVKQGCPSRQRGQSGGGGSSGWKPTKDADKKNSAMDSSRGGGSRRRECWLCGDPNHLAFECPDRIDFNDDDAKGGHRRSGSCRPRRDDKEVLCSLVGVEEPAVSLAPEAGKDFQVIAAAVHANSAVCMLDSGYSHHLMGTKEVFVDLQPRDDVKHVRRFNGALQDVQGSGIVALQGEAGRQVLIPNVLYVPGVRANLLLAGELKEIRVNLQEDGNGMLLVLAVGDVLARASYTGRVLCTDLRPCSAKSTTHTTEVVVLRAVVSVTKSTPDRLHARLAHVGMNTIRSSAKHEVATGLDLNSASGADLPCILCVGGKLARHTFPDQGSDADDVLAVMHVDLCGPFWVAAKDGSLYFLLLKDRKTRYVWVRSVAKNSDALQEFVQGVPREAVHRLRERQGDRPRPDLPLHLAAERHGEARDADGGGVSANDAAAHGCATTLVAPRSTTGRLGLQLPGAVDAAARDDAKPAADREEAQLVAGMGMGLHGAVLGPRAAAWWKVEAKGQVGPSPRVSEESKGWELLDIADNRVVTASNVVCYENMSQEVWKSEHRSASGQPPTIPPTDTSTATLLLLAEVSEPATEDVEDVPFPPLSCPLYPSPCGRPAVNSTLIGEEQAEEVQPTLEKAAKKAPVGQQPTGEQAAVKPTTKQFRTRQSVEEPTTGENSAGNPAEVQQDDEGSEAGDDGGDAKESTDSDVMEVQLGPRQSGRIRRPPDSYVPGSFTTAYDEVDDDLQYNDAEEDEDFPELHLDMHADPEHHWDISMMTVKEALELVECPPEVNIMMNRWVLTSKYHIDDTVEREKARLVVKGFTQVYGANYDETYAPVSSYITLRIFLSIVAVLDFILMQLDMKNVFLALDDLLLGAGWKSHVDTALYFKVGDDKVTCWVLVYVNDLLAASSSAAMLKELTELLKAAFELREISLVQKYLGLEIVCGRSVRKLWLHQQGYADKLRRWFLDEEQNGRTPKTLVSVDAYEAQEER